MKKYFYLAAVSAMMLTACSSENDVVQPTTRPTTPQVVAQQQAVAFDTYLAGTTASTRAGDPEGVMTTDKLKTANKGFGVFAYYADGGAPYASSLTPNFMYNEQVSWANPNGGWTYSPLKYWPNETTKDSQDPTTATATSAKPLDKISFFAYAPYVNPTQTGSIATSPATDALIFSPIETKGITGISANSVTGDPLVEWKYSNDVDHNVDLLWGVAPKGMDYTAVNGTTVPTHFGYPLTDLVKPDKDMKVKFLFQHALSRIGLSVVSAIDQIAAGDDGGKFNTNQTRVLIEKVTIKGTFGTQGVLNLNNIAENVANWSNVTYDPGTSVLFTFDNGVGSGTNKLISKDLRYIGTDVTSATTEAAFLALNEGVLPSEKLLVKADADPNKQTATNTPAYAKGTVLYHAVDDDYVVATTTATEASEAIFIFDETTEKLTQVGAAGASVLDGAQAYYKVSATSPIAASTPLTSGTVYYQEAGTAPNLTYTKFTAGATDTSDGKVYEVANVTKTELSGNAYASASAPYYTGLIPRYMMFIPSASGVKTNVTVEIKYHVVTYDDKLNTKKSDITNEIAKTASFQFENGKSYNLKLILGLTSVKLDATVADWQVGDDAEVWLPQNVQP